MAKGLDGSVETIGPVMARMPALHEFALDSVRPFPAHESAVVHFSLPRQEAVTLAVYDVRGRRIRLLLDKVQGIGDHWVTWDCRSDAGGEVGGGLYFVRLGWRGGTAVRRAAFVR